LQEAYIRWHKTDSETIQTPEAWLVTAVTRLSIDRLRKASVQRETYIGPWLPEPLMMSSEPTPQDNAEIASGLSLAFMVLLERLSPTERAVFLLHDIFDCDYSEISRIIGKSEAASRQIVHRARERVRTDKPRFESDEGSRANLIRKFVKATYAGDEQTLMSIFAEDVALTSDGGGKVHAARRTVYGSKRLARLYTLTVSKHRDHLRAYLITMNGETSVVEFANGEPVAATAFSINDGKITAAYRVMNPDKLRGFIDIDEKYLIDLSQN
jgi:RNA polymerase sigma-70 factor (ECF subfamily)